MTDILTHEQFDALVSAEFGDTLPRPALLQSFNIEEVFEKGYDWDEPKTKALKALSLNVTEPSMYTDKKGQVIVVLPHGQLTYGMINSFFPARDAWLYTLSATVGSDLNEKNYYFRYGRDEEDGNVPLPKFRLADTKTH